MFYVIAGTSLEVFDVDDKLLTTLELHDGNVIPLRIEGGELVVVGNDSLRVPVTHSARNAGTAKYREILVGTITP